MVYVCTLLLMNFVTHTVGSLTPTPSPIVIDWSGYEDEATATPENVEKMISWVRSYPRKKDIHVYLGKLRQRHVGRKLQGELLALGCTVSTKQLTVR